MRKKRIISGLCITACSLLLSGCTISADALIFLKAGSFFTGALGYSYLKLDDTHIETEPETTEEETTAETSTVESTTEEITTEEITTEEVSVTETYTQMETSEETTEASSTAVEETAETQPEETAHIHSFIEIGRKDANCGQMGVINYSCSCGETKNEYLSITGNHSYVEYSRIQATCVGSGHINYQCSVCGGTKTETIPATGEHKWILTEQDGQSIYRCSVCSEQMKAE